MYSINNIKFVLKYLLKSYHMESFILCTCMHDIFSLVDISLMYKVIVKIPIIGCWFKFADDFNTEEDNFETGFYTLVVLRLEFVLM